MKKYGESNIFYTANKNTTADAMSNSNEVKITINVPIYDAKEGIDDMNVVAMVKGEYQIKTIDVQNELKNGNKKNNQVSIPLPSIGKQKWVLFKQETYSLVVLRQMNSLIKIQIVKRK
jgi:hypothetical protein